MKLYVVKNGFLNLSLQLTLMIFGFTLCAVGQSRTTAGSALGYDPTPSSSPSTHTTASPTNTSAHSSSGGHSGNSGDGGGGNPAAEISQQMHEQLAADNATRDKERNSLSESGAAAQSNLDTLFTNAAQPSPSPNDANTPISSAVLSGNAQTSDNDFIMPIAPGHDPGYSDVLTMKAGTDALTAQIGPSSSDTQVTGVDDPNADPNVQALKLIGRPIAQSQQLLPDVAKAILTPEEYLAEKGIELVRDMVIDRAVESLKGSPSYVPPPAPNPAPGPVPPIKK